MRPVGWRSFYFPASNTLDADGRGTRVTVLPDNAPLWWRMWLRCRPEDIRWAVHETSSCHNGRFVALALEHAAARRQGRTPNPEVEPVTVGRWWVHVRWFGRLSAVGAMLGATVAVVLVLAVTALAAIGVVQVEVRLR